MIDWQSFKMRCSSLSYLFTEPKSKQAKEAGELSETAKTHLQEVYIEEMYGIVEEEVSTKEMKKGHIVENKIIGILSEIDGQKYQKNTIRKTNEWITGLCDIDTPELVDDVKAPWDMSTLIPRLMEPIPKVYECQIQGYMFLWNKQKGRVSWVAVDCPDDLLLEEEKKIYFRTGVIWEEDPVYLAEVEKMRRRLKFEHYIPLNERVVRKEVIRDDFLISMIPQKVTKAREYLSLLHRTHLRGEVPKIPPVDLSSIQLIKIKK